MTMEQRGQLALALGIGAAILYDSARLSSMSLRDVAGMLLGACLWLLAEVLWSSFFEREAER